MPGNLARAESHIGAPISCTSCEAPSVFSKLMSLVLKKLTVLRVQMTKGWSRTSKSMPTLHQPYLAVRNEISVQGMTVYKVPQRQLIPVALRKKLVSLAHEIHQGIVRTKQRLHNLY
ncbi:hypothetical protein GOODEAATRI_006944 [Goodea atripinnis]|uniref:Uncharacterized protein n=1 Tax=Goodea atripinnis TaxID=208336 RepID=A0ABV0PLP5_9TELE